MAGMNPESCVQFVRERIAEEKAIAEACQHRVWTLDGSSIYGAHPTDLIVDWVYDDAAWAHIAGQDPARVISGAISDMAVLDWHANLHTAIADAGGELACVNCDNASPDGPHPGEEYCDPCGSDDCETVRRLALRWSWHPEYRAEEWEPCSSATSIQTLG